MKKTKRSKKSQQCGSLIVVHLRFDAATWKSNAVKPEIHVDNMVEHESTPTQTAGERKTKNESDTVEEFQALAGKLFSC